MKLMTYYLCERCTACCRWPGQVKLSDQDISAASSFLGLPEFDFIQQYTRLRADRMGLALQDKENGECIFLDGRDCRIQAVKPKQCQGFPNAWRFPGFESVCRAKAVEMPEAEYRKLVAG
jgi:uncharacterized protein